MDQAASQVAAAGAQARDLMATGQPLVADVRRAADELARTATALREAAAEDSTVRQNADRALTDVSRAARSLRELTELLDRHPDALLRGRGEAAP